MSMIQCEIIHTSLEAPPPYTAISYTWGDPDDTIDIRVNGSWMKVTASLHGALEALRKPDDPLLVWADAICINQSDKAEQSSQVQLMRQICSQAETVMAWLGPESHGSNEAVDAIHALSQVPEEEVDAWIQLESHESDFDALVHLFERDYWSRVWVVQEILNAKDVTVRCGAKSVRWPLLLESVALLDRHEPQLRACFPSNKKTSRARQSYPHILISGGPASIDIMDMLAGKGAELFLDVLRICRTKHTSQPRDKVFGVMGILPDVRSHLFPDYNVSLRQVYTDVVDFLLHRTKRLDIICESIHFPLNASSTVLPTWVPDWSYVQHMAGLGRSYQFLASGETDAIFSFVDARQRTKLRIEAIHLGTVSVRGIAVGTYCGLDDSLMAFLHWRSKMLTWFSESATKDEGGLTKEDDAFCRTISLGQRAAVWEDSKNHYRIEHWTEVCYHAFATLIAERLPSIRVDDKLQSCMTNTSIQAREVLENSARTILQERCESRMMGRCFFITDDGKMGMGTGFLEARDIICVPLGCCTPVILRPEGEDNEYRFVGDCYVDGYMNGEAIEAWKKDQGRKPEPFVLR
ncbi:hypothetical protein PG991_010386 [Apiospora marii]|uniref:Heterokaryon incompatibility domain-containing protein n=1 Tax=Apiospora marii TaxID=335849 RepID=A0ABR1RJF4_9PEZI